METTRPRRGAAADMVGKYSQMQNGKCKKLNDAAAFLPEKKAEKSPEKSPPKKKDQERSPPPRAQEVTTTGIAQGTRAARTATRAKREASRPGAGAKKARMSAAASALLNP